MNMMKSIAASLLIMCSARCPAVDVSDTSALPDSVRKSILIVKGARGSGTAFFARQGSNVYIFSAMHVFAGNSAVRMVDVDGRHYRPVSLEGARDRDLIRITVSNPPATDLWVADAPNAGSPLAVCGNAGGEDVVRAVRGTILGLGPEKVETDAQFIGGHSGSPMVLTNDGVVGVATYLMRPNAQWEDTNTPFFVTRRFGYRISTVTQWVPIGSSWFSQEANAVKDREEMLQQVSSMLSLWAMDPYEVELTVDDGLPKTVRAWVIAHNAHVVDRRKWTDTHGHGGGTSPLSDDLRKEIEQLRTILDHEFKGTPRQWHLDFFKQSWNDCQEMQTLLLKALDHVQGIRTSSRKAK